MKPSLIFLSYFVTVSYCQQVWDIWQTTWDKTSLFKRVPVSSPLNFLDSTSGGNTVQITISEDNTYQTISGFGGTLTDSSAIVLNNLKRTSPGRYWDLLNRMFSATDGAGLSYIRIPIGASDFSSLGYSLDDSAGDATLQHFSMDAVPSDVFSVINDIQSVNEIAQFHILPWSPPAWMKTNGTMNGGSLNSQYIGTYANYLMKAIRGFQAKGVPIYAISIQNEPENSNPTYPSCLISANDMATIGRSLRQLFKSNGIENVRIIGYEHNWDHAGVYPVNMIKAASDAFDGVAFHCYAGVVSNQDVFHQAFPTKEIYLTECSGTIGSDFWEDMKWYINNLWIGSLEYNAKSGLMWNIALDGNGKPRLPGTDSCDRPGCRPLVTVNSDGSFSLNQEFFSMAHVSKAVVPNDPGGPSAERILSSISGPQGWGLRVIAFKTDRLDYNDWPRYSLVVMNRLDRPTSSWNPTPVTATINFRGRKTTYTFPVGITTLWWYAQTLE